MKGFVKLAWFCAVALSTLLSVSAFAVNEGQPAPAVNLPSLDGKQTIKLDQLKGKVVYVDFWASWCGPCRKSFPHYQALYQELAGKGFEIIGINLDEDASDAKKFLAKSPVDFTILMDPKGKSPEAFGLRGMPTSYLVDRKGTVRLVHEGFKEKDVEHLKAEITKLLSEK